MKLPSNNQISRVLAHLKAELELDLSQCRIEITTNGIIVTPVVPEKDKAATAYDAWAASDAKKHGGKAK